jgi:hypothetical protein
VLLSSWSRSAISLIQTPGDANLAGVNFGSSKGKTTGRVGRKTGSNAASHREIPVKVTAWIDEGVVPLVLALNGFPGVMTLDSCQGDPGQRPASVFFCLRGETVTFAERLAATLTRFADRCDYTLTVEWRAGADEPIFRLVCPAAHVCVLADAVRAWE